MVHGHAYKHGHPFEALLEGRGHNDHNNEDVIVYTTVDVADDQTENADTKTASETSNNLVGVGPAVAATASATTTKSDETKTTAEATKTTAEVKTTTKEDKTITQESEKQTTAKETTTSETEKAKTTTHATTTEHTEAITTATEETRTATSATQTSFVTSTSSTSADSTQSLDSLGHAVTDSASSTSTISAASSTSTSVTSGSTGMSSGAKAGVAIGVILGVGVIAALIFFIVRKKRRYQADDPPMEERLFSAQNLPPFPQAARPMTPSTAPQLKVRPITQFAPDLSNSASFNSASTAVAGTGAGAALVSRNLTGDIPPPTPPKSAGISPNPFTDPVNPFNTGNEPFSDQSRVLTSSSGPSEPAMAATAAGAAALGAAGVISHESDGEHLIRPGSIESDVRPPNSPSPVSVDGESVSSVAMTAGSFAGGVAAGAGPGPLNVYRVQMDYSPLNDDELPLQTGTLVRMLYEYNDGWALCVRLDRSQQGVAPRTCLSARPVKPRPRPPPGAPGPGPRGPPMMGPNGRPISPAGRGPPSGRFYPTDMRPRSPGGYNQRHPQPGRNMSPVGQFPVPRSMSPGPRAMSPGPGPGMRPGPGPRAMSPGPRSMSPGPYGGPGMQRPVIPVNQRQRSNSAGNVSPPHISAMAPPRPSPLAVATAQPPAPPSPPPAGDLPDIPSSGSPSSAPSSPPGSQIARKPVHVDF
ncbi:hypothetical protein N7466_010938 [Penicillium verhagenii]|uniref:uncharacterized protein n=1 Tax=Penicillium verhagenii TaxID=1562060 RepID=UPI002544FAEF|nr:uncharacterized protein N7466_010938 [Penicillium verhagenii]KAJ5917384.1 hypothetical protein N7466_010938 [Penicillium verhagenii]